MERIVQEVDPEVVVIRYKVMEIAQGPGAPIFSQIGYKRDMISKKRDVRLLQG
jgi:hypothetical protein